MTRRPVSIRQNHPPSLWQVPWLLARFLPYYIRHVILLTYRGHRPLDKVRELVMTPARCHQTAVYDAVLELMLKGYAELAGYSLRPETGRIAVLLTRIGFAFDDEYERRQARQESREFEEVLHSPQVAKRVLEWRHFMQRFDVYGDIKDFLMCFVASLHTEYAAEDARGQTDFDTLLRRAELDSGGLLIALVHVVAKFHEVPPKSELLSQFSSLGVIGKLADDVIDFSSDLAGGRPNLLQLLAKEDEREYIKAIDSAALGKPLSARWWRRNCPRAYTDLASLYEKHQNNLTSKWLRYTSSLMWAPVLLGHARKEETRGRI
jgi:hypothetical protein